MTKKDINLVDLFSGTGGFPYGLESSGFNIQNHLFSEIDKHAIANYSYNFKHAEYGGSVTDVRGIGFRPDIITFGSPCQDFSLAGNRTGMEGQRSVLILEAIRIIKELRPSVFIWENVKGTFSSNAGADFWAILAAFANIGGYRLEWQLLNTDWILPQNRERIYLVGHLAERSKPGIFPITKDDIGIVKGPTDATSVRTITVAGKSGGHHSGMTLIKTLHGEDSLRTIRSGGRSTLTKKHSWDIVKISSATKSGFEVAKSGDGIRFDHLVENSTGRGRVQNQKAHTLDLSATQGVFKDDEFRRLTEIECERLQGFPDDWTKYGIYNGQVKEVSRTQRYRMMGNAVTTKMVETIGRKLKLS